MGIIRILGMQFFGFHGVSEAEQTLGQRFEADLELEYDCGPAEESDNVAKAVDYVEVYGLVRKIMENDRFNLIEAMAGTIRDAVLDRFPTARTVVVRVRKPSVPIGGVVDCVEFEVLGVRE